MEGPTDDPAIVELRARQRRNLWSTLVLSQGVPMICSGDELGRTQRGNNNAYCQDNELTWIDWKGAQVEGKFFEFACRAVALRRSHPSFRRRAFKNTVPGTQSVVSVRWFRADGNEMASDDWENGGWMRTLGMYLDGAAPEIRDPAEIETRDDDFLLILNAHHEAVEFRLPPEMSRFKWTTHLDTARPELGADSERTRVNFKIEGRSFRLLRRENRRRTAKEKPQVTPHDSFP